MGEEQRQSSGSADPPPQTSSQQDSSPAFDPSRKMSQSKQRKGKGKGKHKQFRWSITMSHTLLKILADEATKGNKPSSNFKPESFARVAKEISKKFGIECFTNHVENHLRTIKKNWKIIEILKNKSGFGWDENMKMITADKSTYDEEVEAHPNYVKFLNKKIDMYDEMALVAGKDLAIGVYAKSFTDINKNVTTNRDFDIPFNDLEMYDDVGKSKETASSVVSTKRSHRKRGRASNHDELIANLVKKVDDVVAVIKESSITQSVIDNLFKDVMSIEGYDEAVLASIFDHISMNSLLVRQFMVKPLHLKKIWIDNFLRQHGGGNG